MKLKEIRDVLPKNGMVVIAERTKIPYPEVTRMFKGLETERTPLVIKATAEYLAELEAKHKQAKATIQQALAE